MFEVEKKTKNKQIGLRLTDEEYEWLEIEANKHDLEVSKYVKLLIQREYKRSLQVDNDMITKTHQNSNTSIEDNKESMEEDTKEAMEEDTKICKMCGAAKHLHDFPLSKVNKNNGKKYYKSTCKECMKSKRA